jgi:hypothetical protein
MLILKYNNNIRLEVQLICISQVEDLNYHIAVMIDISGFRNGIIVTPSCRSLFFHGG